MCVATWNVRGVGERKNQFQLKYLLLDEYIDILAVEETKFPGCESISKELGPFLPNFEVCVSHAVGCVGGLLSFFKKSLRVEGLSIASDENGRYILAEVSNFEQEFRVMCTYTPN